MKILQTHKVKNIKLAEVSNTLFKQFNYILQKLKEENAARKFNDTNIIAVPFMTSQTSDTISPNIETVCIGVIVSYDKTSAESYLTNILKSPDHIQDQRDYNDIADQPVDFLDDDPQEDTVCDFKQGTIDDEIETLPCDANHNPFTAIYEHNQSLAPKKSVNDTESFSDYITRTEKKEKVMFGTLGCLSDNEPHDGFPLNNTNSHN